MITRSITVSILFIILIFTTSSAQNTSSGELLRLKQNFFTLLIPSNSDSYGLKATLSSLIPEQEISDQAVVELHQRYPLSKTKIEQYLSTLSASGAWIDINYADKKRSGWEPKTHTERVLELVKAYYSQQTPYYQLAEVEEAIHRALHYWFVTKPVCLNWWYNQIGVPKTLGTAFLLFEERLTPFEKESAIAVMEQAKFGMTGQNKVWLAGNVLIRGLLQADATLVRAARDTIASEIITGGIEGIKEDWSFHQHGAQQQFGNYGLSFVSGMSFFSTVFSGTSLAFTESQLDIIRTLVDQGYRWTIWRGKMDVSALGRQLFHHAPIHKTLSLAFALSELGGGTSTLSTDLAEQFVKENYGELQTSVSAVTDAHTLIGHKHFWQSDYTIHRRPHWMASVKMASDRVVGVESMNGDNMQGYYMADGATYIYQSGAEYLDIFPLWDWSKIPGVTAYQTNQPVPQLQGYKPRNKATFVGGVSDGKQGVTTMVVDRAGIQARKAWVFTPDFVLCLGAGIQTDSSNLAITTGVEQCFKHGELTAWCNDSWHVIDTQQEFVNCEQRFFHNNTGYVVWGKMQHVVAEAAKRKGQWHHVMQMYKPKEVQGEVTTIYLNQGVSPQQGTYQYLILPHANQSQVATFNLSSIQVLQNDTTAQVVYSEKENTWWVVAYQPVALELASNTSLYLDTPAVYMIRKKNKEYVLWVADPSQKQVCAYIRFKNRDTQILLPKSKGKTVEITLGG